MRFLLGFVLVTLAVATSWSDVDTVLSNAVSDKAFPGCVAVVGDQNGFRYAKAFGNFVYPGDFAPLTPGQNPPMQLDTIFDCASLSKVLGTTTAVAQLYEQGLLNLDDLVTAHLGPSFASHPGKELMTLRHLMLHSGGYPPDPSPGFSMKEFGCPATSLNPPPQSFSCQDRILQAIYDQSLDRKPGVAYVYSDLSMMTMMYVVGRIVRLNNLVSHADLLPACVMHTAHMAHINEIALPVDQCYFEAYVRLKVAAPLGVTRFGYLPDKSLLSQCAPTENDTTYRHTVVQGVVHDENGYASGGVQGHAGLFASAVDAAALMHRLVFAAAPYSPKPSVYLNDTTVSYFTTVADASFSTRALGWDVNLAQDQCGTLSPKTFRHTGFTGTQVCGDPDRKVYTVFFTNRVYPTRDNLKISAVRRAFNTAVQKVLDGQ